MQSIPPGSLVSEVSEVSGFTTSPLRAASAASRACVFVEKLANLERISPRRRYSLVMVLGGLW